jgi:hypothetical protein
MLRNNKINALAKSYDLHINHLYTNLNQSVNAQANTAKVESK